MAKNAVNPRNTLIPIEDGGIWIECCYPGCKKWRHSPDYEDPLDVPEKWYCWMNSDTAVNSCSVPQSIELDESEEFVSSKYKAGSIVWAKVIGHPWSPAMVDFCPEFKCYYWFDGEATVPTKYHVTFFGRVARAWIKDEAIKPFSEKNLQDVLETKVRNKKLSAEKRTAILDGYKIARDALHLTLEERLETYSREAWRIAKHYHTLLQTPGTVNQPTPSAATHKRQRKATKSKNVARPSNKKSKKNLVQEPKNPPAQDKIKAQNNGALKKFSKNEVFAVPVKYDVQCSDSSMTDTTTSVTTTDKDQSLDLDDTRSVNSVFMETQAVPQQKQIVKPRVGSGPAAKMIPEKRSSPQKISEIIDGTIDEVIPTSEKSTPTKASFTLRPSVEEEGNSEENNMIEEFEVVMSSPDTSVPCRLALKLKSIREEKLRADQTMKLKAKSENFHVNKHKKEDKPEESRYLRALSEFGVTENSNQNYTLPSTLNVTNKHKKEDKPEESRYLRALAEFGVTENSNQNYRLPSRPLPRKPLPEWAADRKKRGAVLAQRFNKTMLKMMDDINDRMLKEHRKNIIEEQRQKAAARASKGRDPRQWNHENRWNDLWNIKKSAQSELMTSDEDSP